MGVRDLSSVAYKKGNLMRYSLWALAAVCIAVLVSTFTSMMNGNISAVVPDGYKFSVTDNYSEGSRLRTTYYVYDNKIFVEDEGFEDDAVNRVVMIYDGINTQSLEYREDDVTQICEFGSCYERPKVLAVIKQLISRKIGREYINF